MYTAMQKQVDALIAKLTLEEKASLCSGKDLWHLKGLPAYNVPEIMVTDGPHGLRKQTGDSDHLGLANSVPATCFPTAVGLAATWDLELLWEIGRALGEECRQEGIAVLLGPGVNIKRSPLGGRNFEYFSEDPYLTGECAAAFISGVQSQGIGTSIKHFAVNNQEKYRMTINALVDERALHEIYLTGFEKAVRQAQPWTVMAAYNQVNGSYSTENTELLDTILRKTWGYKGVVLSDWGATNDRVEALQAGLDLEMPSSGGRNDQLLVEAVKNGTLQEEVLDRAVSRLLTLILTAAENQIKGFTYDQSRHHQLARKAAAESMVLLKNNQEVLPISVNSKVALIGEFAQKPRYQGAGSSYVNPAQLENAYVAALEIFGDRLTYAPGYHSKNDHDDEKLLQEAVSAAKNADVAVVMAGLTEEYESEGFDRQHLQLPASHNRLIEEICRVNPHVVVVLNNGAPVLMPWLDKAAAVVEAYLPGEAGGTALWDILLGQVNPCGRLAESFPAGEDDYASSRYFPMGLETVEYRESLYVGYRYYDSAQAEPLFPFGYGLSYTTFGYSDLTLSSTKISDDEQLTVSVTIKNTGSRAGKEVVQLYVGQPDSSVFRPLKELKGFQKVYLQPEEKKTVTFVLNKRSFAYYNTELHDWYAENGDYLIMVGTSSRDIRCQGTITMQTQTKTGVTQPESPAVYKKLLPGWRVTKAEFEQIYGRKLPPKPARFLVHRNTPLEAVKKRLVGRILYKKVLKEVHNAAGDNEAQARMMEAVVRELPLRGLVMMSRGALSFEQIDALIDLMNGKYIRGLKRLYTSKNNHG